ncbi:DUF6787 family protein [Roseivirga sp. BDSF3-8]|uniref:DUF6787 family protein n=1 Tax=Roseivirga sp. BDSF3-8 TaxID=3241598 RepID=UPI0035325543
MSDSGIINKLKRRWGVTSVWQVLLILCVFAATGFTILEIKKPVIAFLEYLGIGEGWLRTTLYILLILPIYQVVLIAYGALVGQYRFFRDFVLRMIYGILRLFGFKRKP